MLRSRLGDEESFGVLERYGTVYAYESAETADLRRILEQMTGYSLERFFWTERSGNPVLQVKTSWQPDDKLVRIEIAQTQQGEAFDFPLTIDREYETPDSRTDADSASSRRSLERADRSYYIQAAVLEALSKAQRDPELEPMLAGLERDSHR